MCYSIPWHGWITTKFKPVYRNRDLIWDHYSNVWKLAFLLSYDMTTPMFTPDGRLLQVEYASVAAQQRSLPIVALVLREYRDDSYVKGGSDN